MSYLLLTPCTGHYIQVDYILHDPLRMAAVALRATPSRAEHARLGPMPRSSYPSDHVPIAADLVWRVITPPTEAAAPRRHRDAPKRGRAGGEAVAASAGKRARARHGAPQDEHVGGGGGGGGSSGGGGGGGGGGVLGGGTPGLSAGVSVDTMGIAALKRLVAAAGLSLDGCIELPDLRARAREAQAALSRRAARTARSARTAGSARGHIPPA